MLVKCVASSRVEVTMQCTFVCYLIKIYNCYLNTKDKDSLCNFYGFQGLPESKSCNQFQLSNFVSNSFDSHFTSSNTQNLTNTGFLVSKSFNSYFRVSVHSNRGRTNFHPYMKTTTQNNRERNQSHMSKVESSKIDPKEELQPNKHKQHMSKV